MVSWQDAFEEAMRSGITATELQVMLPFPGFRWNYGTSSGRSLTTAWLPIPPLCFRSLRKVFRRLRALRTLQVLIDDAYFNEDDGTAAARIGTMVIQDDSSDVGRKPKGGGYVSTAGFKDAVVGENQKLEDASQEVGEDEDDRAMTMTKAQLKETAERHNLDFGALMRDAESRGIKIRDDA